MTCLSSSNLRQPSKSYICVPPSSTITPFSYVCVFSKYTNTAPSPSLPTPPIAPLSPLPSLIFPRHTSFGLHSIVIACSWLDSCISTFYSFPIHFDGLLILIVSIYPFFLYMPLSKKKKWFIALQEICSYLTTLFFSLCHTFVYFFSVSPFPLVALNV